MKKLLIVVLGLMSLVNVAEAMTVVIAPEQRMPCGRLPGKGPCVLSACEVPSDCERLPSPFSERCSEADPCKYAPKPLPKPNCEGLICKWPNPPGMRQCITHRF